MFYLVFLNHSQGEAEDRAARLRVTIIIEINVSTK